MDVIDDELGIVGVAAGAFLALVGLAVFVGVPGSHAGSAVVTVGQALGALAAVAVGGGLVWLATRT